MFVACGTGCYSASEVARSVRSLARYFTRKHSDPALRLHTMCGMVMSWVSWIFHHPSPDHNPNPTSAHERAPPHGPTFMISTLAARPSAGLVLG